MSITLIVVLCILCVLLGFSAGMIFILLRWKRSMEATANTLTETMVRNIAALQDISTHLQEIERIITL